MNVLFIYTALHCSIYLCYLYCVRSFCRCCCYWQRWWLWMW